MTDPDRNIMDDFRRWGYLRAKLDPLGQYPPARMVPELETDGAAADKARQLYCGTIGIEFMHIADPAKRRWIPTTGQPHKKSSEFFRWIFLLSK